MADKNLVFVYGTFMRGNPSHGAMRYGSRNGYRFLGEAYTVQHFAMHHCGEFPTVVIDNEGFPLKGELYELDDMAVELMDELEGHPDFFERREFLLSTGHVAWIYIWGKAQISSEPVVFPTNGYFEWANQ